MVGFILIVVVMLVSENGVLSWIPRLQQNDCGAQVQFETAASAPTLRTSTKLVCVLESEAYPQIAVQLADRLSLPLLSQNDLQNIDPTLPLSHALTVEPYNLGNVLDYAVGISCTDEQSRGSKKRKISMKPFYVDFYPARSSRLGKRGSGDAGPDMLTKAVSPRKGFPNGGAVVYDLTAGLGQDSLLIANAGAKRVHMVERDPIVATLLEDALRRLILISEQSNDDTTRSSAATISNCLSMECGDGTQVVESLIRRSDASLLPDIVYLDPMFPARRKSASVKKNMQILHGLLESQEISDATRHLQEESLLNAAFDATKFRVVVKRPVNAPLLGRPGGEQLRPAYQLSASVNRWDVYVK